MWSFAERASGNTTEFYIKNYRYCRSGGGKWANSRAIQLLSLWSVNNDTLWEGEGEGGLPHGEAFDILRKAFRARSDLLLYQARLGIWDPGGLKAELPARGLYTRVSADVAWRLPTI